VDILGDTLHSLREDDWDLGDIGFELDDLDDFMSGGSGGNSGLTDPDDVPEVTEPICKSGQIWKLGDHRLMCGDSTDKDDVDNLMQGEKADMVFTDPPYGMNLDTDYTSMGSKAQKHKAVIGDDKQFQWFDIGAKEQFWFGADYYVETICRDYENLGSWFVWDKYPSDQNDKRFGSAFELIWSKQKHKRKIIRIRSLNVGHRKREAIVHPTQKPSDLICLFIENYSADNQIIWDGFLGSGSTLIACEKTGRKCYGMEIDPHYCDVIIKRWEDFTGKKAELLDE
jgi:DNA modification methylase